MILLFVSLDLTYHYVGESPIVLGNTVILNITFGTSVQNAICDIISRGWRTRKNCEFIHLKPE